MQIYSIQKTDKYNKFKALVTVIVKGVPSCQIFVKKSENLTGYLPK